MYDRERLAELIRQQALQFGDFTLASGKQASFYLDCRCVTMDSLGANLIAAGMLSEWSDPWPDAVGGMVVGAVPVATAILTIAGQQRPEAKLRGFFCRKEVKEHGRGRHIEGPVYPGDKVVVVEDVVTTGGSALKAIEECEKFGLEVVGVSAIIDRLEGGREAFAARGHELSTLFTIRDFGIEPE